MHNGNEEAESRLRAFFAAEVENATRSAPEPPLLAARTREIRPERKARSSGLSDTIASLATAACLAAAVGSAFSGRASGPLSRRVDEALASGSLEALRQDASAYASWVLSIGLADQPRAR